jgi:hypothetical protein
LKAILISPIKPSHREDREREETEIGSDVKITGGSSAGSEAENTGSGMTAPSDPDTAVPDEDIPIQFTKVMGKGRIKKGVWNGVHSAS